MNFLSCGHEINLDRCVFNNYHGPVKCFSCNAMIHVKTVTGSTFSIKPVGQIEITRLRTKSEHTAVR